jgi:pectin methylesterase-like acyl-CoA thioesterase
LIRYVQEGFVSIASCTGDHDGKGLHVKIELVNNQSVPVELIMDEGLVFENSEFADAQNLAISTATTVSLNPAERRSFTLPAYCINKAKSYPSGGKYNATPFISVDAVGADGNNNEVWNNLSSNRGLY